MSMSSTDRRTIQQGFDAVLARVRAIFDNRRVPYDLHYDGSIDRDPEDRLHNIAMDIVQGRRSFDVIRTSVDRIATRRGGVPGGVPGGAKSPTSLKGGDKSITEPTPEEAAPFDFLEQARLHMPWLPEKLLNIYADAWADTGDPNLALTQMRQSNEYGEFYPGNMREDGTVRLTEADYHSEHEAFMLELSSYGMTPDSLDHVFPKLVEAGVHSQEFRRRMANMYTHVAANSRQVREFYAANFGIDDLSTASLLASALDPGTNPAVFEQQFRAAHVGGEGAVAGFNLDLSEAQRMASFGMSQDAARNFFGQAAGLLPTLSTLIERHNDPDDEFDISELHDALILGDPDHQRRIGRLFAQESSQFSPFGLFQIQQGGTVAGIRQQ